MAAAGVRLRLKRLGLASVDERLEAGVRLDFEDGVRLFACPDLLALGWLANRERERRHGKRTYYNFNIRLEATNVCVASCLFCSFARLKPGDPGSYTMSLEQVWDKLRSRAHQPLTEIHVVNGLHPDLPFEYYTEMLRGFKRIRPSIHLKCFTAVEIAFFADLYGKTDEQVLRGVAGGRARLAAGRRRRDLRGACPAQDRARQVRRRSVSGDSQARARARAADEHHDALRSHRDGRGSCGSHDAHASAAGRDAAVSRPSSRSRFIPTTTRCGSCRPRAESRRCACWRSRD